MYKIIIPITQFEWYEIPTDNKHLAEGINNYWNNFINEPLLFIRNTFQSLYLKTITAIVKDIISADLNMLKNTYLPSLAEVELSQLNHEILYTNIFSNIIEKKFSELKNNIRNCVDKL